MSRDIIISILRAMAMTGENFYLDRGDPITGKSYSEENSVYGKICRTTGKLKCPLLVGVGAQSGDIIGPDTVAILDKSGSPIYRHTKYQPKYLWEKATIVPSLHDSCRFSIFAIRTETREKEEVAGFKTHLAATRWLNRKKKFEKFIPVRKIEKQPTINFE